jgi:hypothetical protein
MTIILILLFFHCDTWAQEDQNSIINLDSVKDLLKADKLSEELQKKQKVQVKKKKEQDIAEKSKYQVPNVQDFWSFVSKYWLIKNAQELMWDFQKPDYGLEESFKVLLESLGYYEKKFTIVLINSPNVTHFALPANPNEYILILSVPFIRTLDLTKVEISLLLLEDFFRVDEAIFKNTIKTADVDKFIGSNFNGQKLNKNLLDQILKSYTQFIYEKGFTFQQQFEVTKKIDRILKGNLGLWNSYLQLLKKIDQLVKSNSLYKDYNKIYPSPEIQINWLTEKKG